MFDFSSFKGAFKGDIVEPESPNYTAAILRWNAGAILQARYVAFVKDEDDISLALKFSTTNGIPIAVKCGGHNPSGSSSIEDGLVIDLSRYINGIKVDAASKIAYVGGGATWKTVDEATMAHGLAVPGGVNNDTGVGGLTLGGGFGVLSAKHGLVIDNLLGATVVLANGEIVTASESSHSDLFWGIRGGGGNFGIVTEFILRLHPQRKTVFAGPVIFHASKLKQICEAADSWWAAGPDENQAITIMLGRRSPDQQRIIILAVFYDGSEEDGRQVYKRFFDLGPIVDNSKEMPYEMVNALYVRPIDGRNIYMSGTTLRSATILHAQQLHDRIVEMSTTHPIHPESPPFDVVVGWELIPNEVTRSVPAGATAFRSRGPQPNVVIGLIWDKEVVEGECLPTIRAYAKELAKIVESTEERKPKEDENDGYANYVSDLSVMVPMRAQEIWGENYPRLQQVKKTYDPSNLFNRWFPIQPASG